MGIRQQLLISQAFFFKIVAPRSSQERNALSEFRNVFPTLRWLLRKKAPVNYTVYARFSRVCSASDLNSPFAYTFLCIAGFFISLSCDSRHFSPSLKIFLFSILRRNFYTGYGCE